MKRYWVITPEFNWTDVILDDGTGPTSTECDVIEIEADNKRDAISLGVSYMLKHRYPDGQKFQYVHDQVSSGLSPYTGVRAEEIPDEDDAVR